MTDKKKGNAFTNNPLVRAIGVQKIVVVLVLIAMLIFFSVNILMLILHSHVQDYVQ